MSEPVNNGVIPDVVGTKAIKDQAMGVIARCRKKGWPVTRAHEVADKMVWPDGKHRGRIKLALNALVKRELEIEAITTRQKRMADAYKFKWDEVRAELVADRYPMAITYYAEFDALKATPSKKRSSTFAGLDRKYPSVAAAIAAAMARRVDNA